MSFPNQGFGEENLAKTQTLELRQGDRLPTLVVQVVDDLGNIIDLTDRTAWLSVRRVQSGEGASPWGGRRQAAITDAVNGIITYDWQPFDTEFAPPGTFELILTVIDNATGQDILTAPTRSNPVLVIRSLVGTRTLFQLATPAAQGGDIVADQTGARIVIPIPGE